MTRLGSRLALALAAMPLALSPLAAAETAAPSLRLATDVVPLAQSIDLALDPSKDDYSGSVEIQLEARRSVRSFEIHVRGQKIERLELSHADRVIDTTFDLWLAETSNPTAVQSQWDTAAQHVVAQCD